MIDLFRLCGVARGADGETVREALAALPDDGKGLRDTIAAVLGDDRARGRYERLHLQCRAVAAAADALERDGARDAHGWRERLADFIGREDDGEARRSVRTGPTGDADETPARRAEPDPTEAGPPEDMTWEQYLAWLESMRRHGHEKRDVGPDEGDCVMTSMGPFRVDDANSGDGMSVTMSDVSGRVATVHWNSLSHPVEYRGRHYFHVEAP